MDALHLFASQPLRPAYAALPPLPDAVPEPLRFLDFPGGVHVIGADPADGFAFDSEGPRHEVLLRPYGLADRPVTNAEWRAFMDDGGYARPELWLSDGWAMLRSHGWEAPATGKAATANGCR